MLYIRLMSDTQQAEKVFVKKLLTRLKSLDPGLIVEVVEFDDRPDAVLNLNDSQIGLEVTRCASREQIRGEKMHRNDFPNLCVSPTEVPDGPDNRSRDEIARDMSDFSRPWKNSNELLNNWGNQVYNLIAGKRDKLNRPGFRLFPQNWLLLHDEPGIFDVPHIANPSLEVLKLVLKSNPALPHNFNTVFILSWDFLFRFQNGGLYMSRHGRKKSPEALLCTYREPDERPPQ